MMFKKNFVAVVKCNSKILREDESTVFIPFGSEYSLLLKNLHSRKASVNISIDGKDILFGKSLILDANSEIEIERFVENLDAGNKFKFIQKTEKIQSNRGDRLDDGIIRIEYKFEAEYISYKPFIEPYVFEPNLTWNCNNNFHLNYETKITSDSVTYRNSFPAIDEGITTNGSISNQKINIGNIGILEENSHVITLQLKGETASGKTIEDPITISTKKVCNICGTNNKYINKFCRECGTYLD